MGRVGARRLRKQSAIVAWLPPDVLERYLWHGRCHGALSGCHRKFGGIIVRIYELELNNILAAQT